MKGLSFILCGVLPVTLFWVDAMGQIPCTGGPTIYRCTDQAAYAAKLAEVTPGSVISEGFENEAIWGSARFPLRVTSVLSQGIRWSANNSSGGITTGDGAVRSGSFGVFSYPHGIVSGVPFDVQRDGFVGQAEEAGTLTGVGGWLATNTPGARVRFVIGSQSVDFEDSALTVAFRFFGVINTAGFTRFEIYETEGRVQDQKLIFGDDFSINAAGGSNQAPSAGNRNAGTIASTPVSVPVTATDPNGDALTYRIIDQPAHGVLGGIPPYYVYTPNPGFAGADSFTFRASDGALDSNLATVSILVDGSEKTLYFPQFVDGSAGSLGYRSTIILSNLGADAAVRIALYSSDGMPMAVTLGELGTGSEFELTLRQGQSVSLPSPGTGGLKVGYARVRAGSSVDGVLVFTGFDVPSGTLLFETGVASSTPMQQFSIFVDSTGYRDTGLAIVFPEPDLMPPGSAPAATITLRLFDKNSNLIGEKTLPPLAVRCHFADFVYEILAGAVDPAITQEMEGLLTVVSDHPLVAMTLRQNDNPAIPFPPDIPALTTFPVMTGRLR